MKKYEVTLHVIVQHTVIIEAESIAEAEASAADTLDINHAYSSIEVVHTQGIA